MADLKTGAIVVDAKADGVTDDTAAFQAALDKAGRGGSLVSVPPGQYRFDGTLDVPPGVTLEGIWRGPHTAQLDKGTALLVYGGRDEEDGAPFINLKTASTLKGVTVFHPEQTAGDIRPYPWTVRGQGQHYNVIDVTFVNAYNGIDCGTHHNEGHHLRNVHMCALNKGVFVDYCSDVGRIENVHIHPVYWWRAPEPYTLSKEDVATLGKYLIEHLVGFIVGRTDWQYISNCFVIFAQCGFHFVETPRGVANAVITQSGSDCGHLAVQIDNAHTSGIAFENCQIMAGIEIGPDNEGPVKLTNCGFWGAPRTGSQLVLNGRGTVSVVATHFRDWDFYKQDKPCIQALNGALLMSACEFVGDETTAAHIHMGGTLKSAAIVGCRFRHGQARITQDVPDEVKKNIQLIGNVTA